MDEYWRNFVSGEEATGDFNYSALNNTYIQGIDVNLMDATENHAPPTVSVALCHVFAINN